MRKFIKPAKPDLIVRDHADKLRPLPAEGKEVAWDATWARRERDGDIVVPETAKPAKPVVRPRSEKTTKSEDI